MTDTILSFGGGLQTTTLAILVAQGKVKIDYAIFADTGCEKPETYDYLEDYTKPLFESIGIPFYGIRKRRNTPPLKGEGKQKGETSES